MFLPTGLNSRKCPRTEVKVLLYPLLWLPPLASPFALARHSILFLFFFNNSEVIKFHCRFRLPVGILCCFQARLLNDDILSELRWGSETILLEAVLNVIHSKCHHWRIMLENYNKCYVFQIIYLLHLLWWLWHCQKDNRSIIEITLHPCISHIYLLVDWAPFSKGLAAKKLTSILLPSQFPLCWEYTLRYKQKQTTSWKYQEV